MNENEKIMTWQQMRLMCWLITSTATYEHSHATVMINTDTSAHPKTTIALRVCAACQCYGMDGGLGILQMGLRTTRMVPQNRTDADVCGKN